MLKQYINMDMVKKYIKIYCSIVIFISSGIAIEDGEKNVNKSFAFIKDIYSESWALIIGINDYQNVPPLSYAEKDAVDIRNLLLDQYGFKTTNIITILNEDATKANILKGFNDILTKAKEKDRVLVYYAGHGDTYDLPDGGEMGFLIPVDGDKESLYLSSIKMQEIYDLANMSYAKHILYLVDACYGGLSIQSRGLKKEITPEYLKKLTKEKGRQIITAGGKDEEVIENPKWGHSAFAKSLLKGLGENQLADENDDGIITVDELGVFIKNRVIIDVDGAHTPRQGRIGSDMGEFVFISKTLEEEVAIADEVVDDIKTQLDKQQQQIAQLLELQQKESAVKKLQNQLVTPVIKPVKKPSIKIASTLSILFPGMGHFYSGQIGKGALFTSLELAAFAGIAMSSSNYFIKVDEYNAFENNVVNVGGEWTDAERKQYFEAKNNALLPLIGSSTAAGIIWLWNIRDIKKSASSKYSNSDPISIGINSQGQLEARISF